MKKFFLLISMLTFLVASWASPHNFAQHIPSKETIQAKEKEPVKPDISQYFVCAHQIQYRIVPQMVGKVQTISSTEYLRNYYKYRGKAIPFKYIYENRVFFTYR